MKYSLDDLKRRPDSQPLPDDVNAPAEALAAPSRFDSPEMATAMRKVKQKRLFGKLNVTNADGQQIATISYQKGIAERMTFADIHGAEYLKKPYSIVFIRSVKNDNLINTKRPRGEE